MRKENVVACMPFLAFVAFDASAAFVACVVYHHPLPSLRPWLSSGRVQLPLPPMVVLLLVLLLLARLGVGVEVEVGVPALVLVLLLMMTMMMMTHVVLRMRLAVASRCPLTTSSTTNCPRHCSSGALRRFDG